MMSKNHSQQHEILFQCEHCGRRQMISIVVQSNQVKGASRKRYQCPCPQNLSILLSKHLRERHTRDMKFYKLNYSSDLPLKQFDDDKSSLVTVRRASVINEDIEPVHRSHYEHDFRPVNQENRARASIEHNIKGLIDGCLRSSLHDISENTREKDAQDIVEVEVEYDPILGNVKSTRKRSSTIITKLDNDYASNRHQSGNSRYKLLPIDSGNETMPIWARRRISHSTVKPSDLIREYDKREKLDANAIRRLSRADLVNDTVTPNSTPRPMFSPQNPSMVKDIILRWCQELTQFYKGVNIRNFSTSWADGLAFCAIIHRYFPDEFNFETLNSNDPRQNFDLAFNVAFERAAIEPLIDTDDMILMGSKPDPKVVFTYVQSLYRHLSTRQPPAIMRERW